MSDPELQKVALNVIINCVCAPFERVSQKSSSLLLFQKLNAGVFAFNCYLATKTKLGVFKQKSRYFI